MDAIIEEDIFKYRQAILPRLLQQFSLDVDCDSSKFEEGDVPAFDLSYKWTHPLPRSSADPPLSRFLSLAPMSDPFIPAREGLLAQSGVIFGEMKGWVLRQQAAETLIHQTQTWSSASRVESMIPLDFEPTSAVKEVKSRKSQHCGARGCEACSKDYHKHVPSRTFVITGTQHMKKVESSQPTKASIENTGPAREPSEGVQREANDRKDTKAYSQSQRKVNSYNGCSADTESSTRDSDEAKVNRDSSDQDLSKRNTQSFEEPKNTPKNRNRAPFIPIVRECLGITDNDYAIRSCQTSNNREGAAQKGARDAKRKGSAQSNFLGRNSSDNKSKRSKSRSRSPSESGRRRRQRRKTCLDDFETNESKLLACPFYKRDRIKYKNRPSCCGPGWTHVRRIK